MIQDIEQPSTLTEMGEGTRGTLFVVNVLLAETIILLFVWLVWFHQY